MAADQYRALKLVFRTVAREMLERHDRAHSTEVDDMPRWASRVLLEVTGLRVQRLNEISEVDARAEGVAAHDTLAFAGWFRNYVRDDWACPSAIESYSTLWESINGEGSWRANPLVWVVEFKAVKP